MNNNSNNNSSIRNKINNKIILTLLIGMLVMAGYSNAVSSIEFLTDSKTPFNTQGSDTLLKINVTTTDILDCEFMINNKTINNNIKLSKGINIVYYPPIEPGYNEFVFVCEGLSYKQTYVTPQQSKDLPYIITFILVVLTPLLFKQLGIIQKVSKNNPFTEFVIYTIILLLTFIYGYPLSAFYNEGLFLFARVVCGFGMFMSIWFILVEVIRSYNSGGFR